MNFKKSAIKCLLHLLLVRYFRADTRSEAGRSYNETIIRPVTRRLHTPAGTSVRSRSSRSHVTSEVRFCCVPKKGCRSDPLLFLQDGRTMAERDGGSSFVVSPVHQLYRLHVSLNIYLIYAVT